MVCHFPKRLGSPRHLQPCSATYSSAFSSCRLGSFTLPRCRGRLEAICWYCASVISMHRSISQNYELVLTGPRADSDWSCWKFQLADSRHVLNRSGLHRKTNVYVSFPRRFTKAGARERPADRLFRENFGDLDPRIVQLSPRLTMALAWKCTGYACDSRHLRVAFFPWFDLFVGGKYLTATRLVAEHDEPISGA